MTEPYVQQSETNVIWKFALHRKYFRKVWFKENRASQNHIWSISVTPNRRYVQSLSVLFPHCHRDGESPHWVLTYFVYDSFLPLNFPLSDSCGNVFLLSRFFAFPFRGSCVLTSRFNLWLCFWMVSVGQLKCKRAWGEIDETNPEAGCGRTCLRHT